MIMAPQGNRATTALREKVCVPPQGAWCRSGVVYVDAVITGGERV